MENKRCVISVFVQLSGVLAVTLLWVKLCSYQDKEKLESEIKDLKDVLVTTKTKVDERFICNSRN